MRLIIALRLLLALSVALVSVHTAVGRVAYAGALTVEACAAGGVEILVLDGKGRPVPQHFACPDCVLGGFADLGARVAPAVAPRRRSRRIARRRGGASPASHPLPARRARGPPAAA